MPDREQRQQAGILRPATARRRIDVGRRDLTGPVSAHVDYAWWVTWDLVEAHRQEVIPRPVVHLSAERRAGTPRLLVHGVHRARFERVLEGRGRVVAVAFRPGGLRPFLPDRAWRAGVGALRDREIAAVELLGVDDRSVAAALLEDESAPEAGAERLQEWLERLCPRSDPLVAELAGLVERAEQDSSITRVEQLADLAGVGRRTLERRFVSYVGIGPKWVIQRCRLLDVAAAAHAEAPVDWADLALRLGYADQSHLIRCFTALVGHPPASYVADER